MLPSKAQWRKETELLKKAKKLDSEGKKPAVQFEDAGEETRLDEDCMMEVDSDADSRKKLDLRQSSCEKLKGVRIWTGNSWRVRRKNGRRSCCRLNIGGMVCCQNTKRCRRCLGTHRAWTNWRSV